MVFRTVSAIAALLIFFEASGGKALAQYYPPVQAYPPPQAYPPQGYYPRQGYRPPVVDDDDDDDMVYDLEGRPLPPGAGAKPQANKPPGRQYGSPDRQWGYRDLPPQSGEDYDRYYGVPERIPPGAADSAKQDAIRREAIRSRQPISPGPDDPRQRDYRDVPRQVEDDEPAVIGTRPYYGVPGAILPGPADSAKQDAILQEAMRSRVPISPGQVDPGPDDPSVTGSTGGGGDPA